MATSQLNGHYDNGPTNETTDVIDSSNMKNNVSSESEISIANDVALLDIKLNNFKNPSEFSLSELYKYSLQFYKEKSGKAVHLSYGDKCKLVALNQQVSNGSFNTTTAEALGTFDVIGRDRRLAWQTLGNISKEEAMNQFVNMLNQLTPTYAPYIEAVWADHLEKQRLKIKEDEMKAEEENERKKQEIEKVKEEEELVKQEETKRQIQDALNHQTFSQFKLYAEEQYPSNPDDQAVLIRQLQDQHYLQYMQQVYQQQGLIKEDQEDGEQIENKAETEEMSDERQSNSEGEARSEGDEAEDVVVTASMWTRRDIKEFKESIRQEGGDAVIKVGHGETVTVRVPTHQDGNCLFWEFATDFYDIGFGIHFEWTNDASNVVSIHISETDDDEDEDEDELITADDIERLGGTQSADKPPQSVIIPVYRRDCHDEVYAGSHPYPGQGVYLLKFDNSYSLWRSKMLYYRVYYTR